MADASRRSLGRGLSALLGETDARPAAGPAGEGGAQSIPVELIRRNPDQPRRTFDEAELAELTDSVRERGVLQPILLRPAPGAPGEYQIVAGERRWRAAQAASLHAVPALVRPLNDAEVAEIALVENIQRADLSPLEEALGYRTLMDRYGRTQEMLAKAVGKSRSHVANALRLLNLPHDVREHLSAGRLSAGHARAIAAATDPSRLARLIVEGDLTVRQAEALARETPGQRPASGSAPRSARSVDADTAALEQDLGETLGVSVKILDRGGAGELRLRYDNLEQLDALCRRLSGAG